MEKIRCDVLIVGAGPAGSSLARRLAEKEIDVLVIDKKQEIGAPKRCGEGLNKNALALTGVKATKRIAPQEIHGFNCYVPSGKRIVYSVPGRTDGYILERKMFEKELARLAIRAGARYMVKTQAKGIVKEEGYVKGVVADSMDGELEIRSNIVVGADGRESLIGRMAGLSTLSKLNKLDSGFQYEMAGCRIEEPERIELYFGNKIAPGGYVWIFPKGDDIANVGIGIRGTELKTAKHYLDNWIRSNPKVKDAQPMEVNAGGIPMGGCTESIVGNGIALIGDAAHQVNPIHGGGMELGIRASIELSDVISKAISDKDYTKGKLIGYEKIWEEKNRRMQNTVKVRGFIGKLTDEQMDMLAGIMEGSDLADLSRGMYLEVIAKLMTKAPKIAGFVKSFFF